MKLFTSSPRDQPKLKAAPVRASPCAALTASWSERTWGIWCVAARRQKYYMGMGCSAVFKRHFIDTAIEKSPGPYSQSILHFLNIIIYILRCLQRLPSVLVQGCSFYPWRWSTNINVAHWKWERTFALEAFLRNFSQGKDNCWGYSWCHNK